jgi:hypothetical protein
MQAKPPLVRQSSPNRLAEVLERLDNSCWYWGAMDSVEAMRKLKYQRIGTYLLRDSTDSRHLFTLSVRTDRGMTNVRILYKRGRFSMDSIEPVDKHMPNFDCVLKLIYYYMRVSNNLDGRKVFATESKEEESDAEPNSPEEIPFVLKNPSFHKPPTLKHLCRTAVNRTYNLEQVLAFNLPPAIENYMLKYPYPI